MSSVRVLLAPSTPGTAPAHLAIARLPGGKRAPVLIDNAADRARTAPNVELHEGSTYRYVLDDLPPGVHLEPAELFDPDDESRLTGRLQTREAVGEIHIQATSSNGGVWLGRLEVRATKFADEAAFALMLSDLARLSVEALHQGFAPSAGRFSQAAGPTPRLLYQRFAILHAQLFERELAWGIDEVLSRPDRSWVSQVERRPAGRPVRGSSALSRNLSRPGPRVRSLDGLVSSLPARIATERTEESVDTVPNRYVRFVLEQWRALTVEALVAARSLEGAPQRRGIHQAQRALDRLDEVLAHPTFRGVGRLTAQPQDNQVLLRRAGYRQVASAAALVDASLGLELDLEDPFLVSRRSIATLYEYWVFVRLARAVARACGGPDVEGELFRVGPDGMSLILKSAHASRVSRSTVVNGEKVLIDLFFNRRFAETSWTRPMRPDASLLVRTVRGPDYWLHFDAKYKVDWSTPFDTGDVDEEEEAERLGRSKRDDLLKMHAYRDAIRGSAGSFVIFPGDVPLEFRFDAAETLPALGAFGLRPDQVEEDSDQLEAFVGRVLRHAGAAATRHQRVNYWSTRSYAEGRTDVAGAAPPSTSTPPADTPVLLAYVRSVAQWRWIQHHQLYNLRSGARRGAIGTDGEELSARLLLLYGHTEEKGVLLATRRGAWRVASREQMVAMSYPSPPGDAYLLAEVDFLTSPRWLSALEPRALLPPDYPPGQPCLKTWLDVLLSIDS